MTLEETRESILVFALGIDPLKWRSTLDVPNHIIYSGFEVCINNTHLLLTKANSGIVTLIINSDEDWEIVEPRLKNLFDLISEVDGAAREHYFFTNVLNDLKQAS